MKRLAIIVAFLAVLTLPAIALASGAFPGGGRDLTASDNQMGGASVTIVDFAFSPAWVSVPAGGTVSWYNAGAAPHTVSSDFGAFDSGTLGSGGGFSMTFWTPGSYTYHCAIHPGMTGTVQVS